MLPSGDNKLNLLLFLSLASVTLLLLRPDRADYWIAISSTPGDTIPGPQSHYLLALKEMPGDHRKLWETFCQRRRTRDHKLVNETTVER